MRSFRSRWLYLTILLTIVTLWMSLGTESYWLLRGAEMEGEWLVEMALTGDSHALSLPILATLPAAAAVQKEIRSGAVRSILFRRSMGWYIQTRTLNLLLTTLIAQSFGVLLFLAVIAGCVGNWYIPVWHFIIGRLLAVMLYAVVGSAGALLTKDIACAYAFPVAVGYAANMIRTRFWLEAKWLDPTCWLTGDKALLGYAGSIVLVLIFVYAVYLRWEVRRHV